MVMYNRETLNEIKSLLNNKSVLRGIQRITKIDYNKPFKIYEHTEPFTPKKLVKLYGETNSIMYAFVVTNRNSNDFSICIKPVQISNDGDINLNVNTSTCTCISTFWTKLNFNEVRKNNTLTYVFVSPITSRVEQTNVIATYNYNNLVDNADILLDRFKIVDNCSDSVKLMPIGNISNSYSSKSFLADKTIIDKSGYIVHHKHFKYGKLTIKLCEQRIAKEKDNFIKSGELKKLINKLKTIQNAVRKDLIIRLASMELNEQNTKELGHISSLINEIKYSMPYCDIDLISDYDTKENMEKIINRQIGELIRRYHAYFGNTSPYSSLFKDTNTLRTSAETNVLTNLL